MIDNVVRRIDDEALDPGLGASKRAEIVASHRILFNGILNRIKVVSEILAILFRIFDTGLADLKRVIRDSTAINSALKNPASKAI